MKAKYEPRRGKDGIIVDQILSAGHMKPEGKTQDVHEESSVQNYDIGTRMVMDDRVFRYCYAKGALQAMKGGASDVMPREGAGDAVEYAVGTFQVSIPMNQYGDDYDIEKAAGYWDEGYYWAGISDPSGGMLYRIKSSAVAAAGVTSLEGGHVIATLYEALKTKIPASTWQTTWVNPYKTCVAKIGTHQARRSIICQPLIDVQATYYFWGQTWGPCFGYRHGAHVGRADLDRTLFYHTNAAIMSGRSVNFSSGQPLPQIAGSLITCTRAWTNMGNSEELGGDQFYMLQLSP